MNFANKTELMKIAQSVVEIVPNCCGVTLGGSRAHGLQDAQSDVEMYFYSTDSIPALADIDACLLELGAEHKRWPEFLWNEYPWGPHSFFLLDGLYFEIGYRIIGEIDEKIQAYLAGNVAPQKDCHDLGMGYVYSGLAASVCAEKILLARDNAIKELKTRSAVFPETLHHALEQEYMATAKNLLDGKLASAALREDIFFYEVLASRIIRSLMIMAFSISGVHFPGDKWNEALLLRTGWVGRNEFLNLLKKHWCINSTEPGALRKKRDILLLAYNLVEAGLHEAKVD